MKLVFPIALLVCSTSLAQGSAIKKFSKDTEQFEGTKQAQANFLLRSILPMGVIDSALTVLPDYLNSILVDSIELPVVHQVEAFITSKSISQDDLGGSLKSPISKNTHGTKARYFVIHDTSTPNFNEEDFPSNVDSTDWKHNDVHTIWKDRKLAHVFVGRTGKSYSPVHFDTPWRATKFEYRGLDAAISKGLFIHIELVQPRRSDPSKWTGNDILAPTPGFTVSQYERLALLYISASYRSGSWLIPAFHANLDAGIPDGHDDPQNFNLSAFSEAISRVMKDLNGGSPINLWATYYYIPTVSHTNDGLALLNASNEPTGFRLDSLDWCDAAIQGTVSIIKNGTTTTLNYAGRSNRLLYDCRKCPIYSNYDGYLKTGKVLWAESDGFGKGVNDFKLIPCKTVAVDPNTIPIGSVIFIQDAVGTKYVNHIGEQAIHNGYFFAGDVGSKINGSHIDVFIGHAKTNPFDFVSSRLSEGFGAVVIQDKSVIQKLTELHQN